MAAAFTIKVRGIRAVQQALNDLARQNEPAASRALMTEAEIEMTEMKERTPVDTGALRGSGRVESLGSLSIKWVFGGTAIDYAIAVHENLDVLHNPGQSKYMESVVMEFFPNVAQRVGRRWAQEMGL